VKDKADKTQNTNNGSHAPTAMAQRLMVFRITLLRLSQLFAVSGWRFTDGICRLAD
jgi:hypothetical protein